MCQPHSPTVQIQLSLQLQKASGLVRSADTHAHIQIIHHHILWVVHLTCMGEASIGMNRLSLLSQSDPYSLPLHWKACLVCLNMHTSPIAHCPYHHDHLVETFKGGEAIINLDDADESVPNPFKFPSSLGHCKMGWYKMAQCQQRSSGMQPSTLPMLCTVTAVTSATIIMHTKAHTMQRRSTLC